MKCDKCGGVFEPEPDVKRLMAVGQIAKLCNNCAERPPIPKISGLEPAPVDPVHRKLRRIDWFDEQNRKVRFIALPPTRNRYPKTQTLRKPRKTDQHVFVLSASDTETVTSPPVRIQCNIDTFEERRIRFRATKTPAAWDAFTGVAKIEVPYNLVKRVEREPDRTYVHLKTGAYLRLLYS